MGWRMGWIRKYGYLLLFQFFRTFKKMVFERNKKIDELQQIETVLETHIPQLVKKDATSGGVHITRATAVSKKKNPKVVFSIFFFMDDIL
jgi:hypothetical protein